MPAVKWAGRRWQIASDFVPFVAALGIVFHCVWIITMLVVLTVTRPYHCDGSANSLNYTAVAWGIFTMFVISLFIEAALFHIGMQGEGTSTIAWTLCAQHCYCCSLPWSRSQHTTPAGQLQAMRSCMIFSSMTVTC